MPKRTPKQIYWSYAHGADRLGKTYNHISDAELLEEDVDAFIELLGDLVYHDSILIGKSSADIISNPVDVTLAVQDDKDDTFSFREIGTVSLSFDVTVETDAEINITEKI